jgi:tetratricopeptide (TPR) repeat protein
MRLTPAGGGMIQAHRAAAAAMLCLATTVATAQDPTDDIFSPKPGEATEQPAVDPAPAAQPDPTTPAPTPPSTTTPDLTTPTPTTPAADPTTPPAADPSAPALAPGERRKLPDMIQDQGREINPAAKAKLQEAFEEFYTPGHDPKKVVELAQEAIKIQTEANQAAGDNLFEAYHVMGLALMEVKDYENAIALFSQSLQRNPNAIASLVGQGQAYFELKEYRLAADALTQALNLDNKNVGALYWRGRARAEQRDYQAAIEDLQEAVGANRGFREAYTALGKAQVMLGDAESALAALDRAVKLDVAASQGEQKSTYAECYFERGKLYASIGMLEKAATDLATAVERDGKNKEYLMTLGALRTQQAIVDREPSNFTLAVEAFNRAAAVPKTPEEEKEDVSPYVALANTYVEQGNMEADKKAATDFYRQAVEQANKAIAIEPKASIAFYQRGVAQRMLENYDAAVASLSEAVRLSPALAQAYYRRGIIWYHRGDYRLAGQDFDDALRSDPTNARYLVWRGLAFARQEKFIDAIDSYSAALRSNPLSSRAHHNRALAYVAIGEHEKALSDFNQAIRINTRDEEAFYRRGVVLSQMGETEKALQSLSTAIALKADFAPALSARGRIYQQSGNAKNAAADFAAAKKAGESK